MVAKKSSGRKPVKSLTARKLTSSQAKRIKGGGLPPPTNTVSAPLITEIGFPAADAGSKDPAKITIHFTNELFKPKF